RSGPCTATSIQAVWREAAASSPPKGQAPRRRNSQVRRTAGAAHFYIGASMLDYIFMIAITGEAMSGALVAGRRNMDIFGVAFIAFVTALGGGTVRDMLLGNFPVNWTQNPIYIYLTIPAGLFTIIVARYMHRLHRLFLVTDAMGLVAFTVIGCNIALKLDYNYPIVVVIMAGITTGIFGGILRDILCNRTPMVLHKELYASVSLIVALFYLTLIHLNVNHDINLLASFCLGMW